MIVEYREYTILIPKREAFWTNYRDYGIPIQLRYLHSPIGFYFVDVGRTTNFIHMWPFDSYADRETRRHSLHLDPDWNQYVKSSHKFIIDINTRILRPLDFRAGAEPAR
jgi:hypothetical protein